MTPGTRVAVERPRSGPAADPLTGKTGTVTGTSPDGKWITVKVDGCRGDRTISPKHLQQLNNQREGTQ